MPLYVRSSVRVDSVFETTSPRGWDGTHQVGYAAATTTRRQDRSLVAGWHVCGTAGAERVVTSAERIGGRSGGASAEKSLERSGWQLALATLHSGMQPAPGVLGRERDVNDNNKIEIDSGMITLRQPLGHERRPFGQVRDARPGILQWLHPWYRTV